MTYMEQTEMYLCGARRFGYKNRHFLHIDGMSARRSRKPHSEFQCVEEVVFQMEIEQREDILLLEQKIREFLQCESLSECRFIHSAPYKQMIMSILLRLNKVISFEEETRLHFGNNNSMVLFMHNNAKTVEIIKKSIESILDYTVAKMETEEALSFQNEPQDGIEHIETRYVDHKKRKYPRKNQEETFVANLVHNKKKTNLKISCISPLLCP
jgi:hypothetical protein